MIRKKQRSGIAAIASLFLIMFLLAPVPRIAESPESAATDAKLLPETYSVFVKGTTVINHPAIGFELKQLPTRNVFKGSPGCYVACYSHEVGGSVYPVSGTIFVMGQVRVEGKYVERICRPKSFEEEDISAMQHFKDLCNRNIDACLKGRSCWAGGDTGGWFGIQ